MKKIKKRSERVVGKLDGRRVKMTQRDWLKAVDNRRRVSFKEDNIISKGEKDDSRS